MFREWLRRRRFTRALRETLQARKDEFPAADVDKAIKACDDKLAMKSLMKQCEVAPGLHGGIRDWDWESILNWVQTFLVPLVKALLPLVLLLGEENHGEKNLRS